LVARWWLPLAGLIAGIAVGYLLSLGGHKVYEAKATLYLGQPLSASGTQIQGPSTNPSSVHQVVTSAWAQRRAERVGRLRQGASSRGLSTAERLIIASQLNGQTLQRSQVVDQLATYQNQLTLAQTVEQSKILAPASAFKTTARSRRNSALVGALIGLLLGIVAALLWEPVAGRLQKHS